MTFLTISVTHGTSGRECHTTKRHKKIYANFHVKAHSGNCEIARVVIEDDTLFGAFIAKCIRVIDNGNNILKRESECAAAGGWTRASALFAIGI